MLQESERSAACRREIKKALEDIFQSYAIADLLADAVVAYVEARLVDTMATAPARVKTASADRLD